MTARPFAALGNAAMQIGVDILPKPNRNPEIRVQFTGAFPPNTIKLSDVAIWTNALNELVDRAKVIAAELRNGTAKRPPKKPSKK